jgi:uncharacterized protein (DUF1697 family)
VAERHVALIRGINVGRAKRIAMADLRSLMTALGYQDVRTLLNSGNIVFSAPAARANHALRIERAITERIGVSARVTVLDGAEIRTIVRENSLGSMAENPSRLMVCVPADAAARTKLVPLTTREWSPEGFALGRRAAYIWCPDGIIDSKAAKEVDRALGDAVTTRNWNTMTKLHLLVTGDPR